MYILLTVRGIGPHEEHENVQADDGEAERDDEDGDHAAGASSPSPRVAASWDTCTGAT